MPAIAVTRDTLIAARESLRPRPGQVVTPQYGPPQPPLDELWGTTITPEMVGDMGEHPFGEDAYSVDHRVKAAQWLLDAYETNRHRPIIPRVWCPPGLYLLSGKMGDGKTLVCINIGVIFMMCGWPAYSTASAQFGKMLDESQTFAFPDFVTPGSFMFADEIHAIYGRYQGASIRNQTMAQATAAFRKQRIYCFGATAREWLLGSDIKASVVGLGYPYRSGPKGVPTAPPWAYRAIRWYYPEPWGGKELREDFGEGQHQEVKRYTEYVHSYDLTRAAAHFNSWEKIKLDFGGGKSAAAFRADMGRAKEAAPGGLIEEVTAEAIGLTILGWYEEGRFVRELDAYNRAQETGKRTDRGEMLVPLTSLAEMLDREGYSLGKGMVQKALSAVDCRHTHRTVSIQNIDTAYHKKLVDGTMDMDMAYREEE